MLNRANLFLFFLLIFVFGVFLGGIFKSSYYTLVGEIILLLLVFTWKARILKIILISFFLIILGGWHYNNTLEKRIDYSFPFNQDKVFYGVVNDYPATKSNRAELIVKIFGSEGPESCQIIVSAPSYSNFQYGDELILKGKIKKAEKIDDFDYPAFLAKDNICGSISYPELIEKNSKIVGGNIIKKSIFALKAKATESIRNSVNFPYSALIEGMFLGERGALPQDIVEQFRLTGLSHIIVISGLHIALLAVMLKNLLYFARINQTAKNFLLFILLLAFVIMTGAAASTVRAFLLFVSLLLAKIAGRKSNPIRSLVFIGALILVENPLLLRYDIGFQLSFAAVLSIVYFVPIIEKWLEGRFTACPQEILNNLVVAVSAQILTWPIIAYNFGKISLIAPLSNLLVVPFLSLIIMGALAISVMGFVYLPAAKIIGALISPFLAYILAIPNYLSKLPFSFTELKTQGWIFVGYYILAGLFIYRWQKKIKNENLQQNNFAGLI